jgi:hypothetical protein
MLTDQELKKVISWQPYKQDWFVDRNQSDDNVYIYYRRFILEITKNEIFDTKFTEDGGLSNYLEFICYPLRKCMKERE